MNPWDKACLAFLFKLEDIHQEEAKRIEHSLGRLGPSDLEENLKLFKEAVDVFKKINHLQLYLEEKQRNGLELLSDEGIIFSILVKLVKQCTFPFIRE